MSVIKLADKFLRKYAGTLGEFEKTYPFEVGDILKTKYMTYSFRTFKHDYIYYIFLGLHPSKPDGSVYLVAECDSNGKYLDGKSEVAKSRDVEFFKHKNEVLKNKKK
jgi:hypothetical protein